MARVIRLPDHGRLIVCTDLQGCLRDYRRIVERATKLWGARQR